jgi:hypothetical protein
MAGQFGSWKVLAPEERQTFAPKKLRAPKKPKVPNVGGVKVPKVPTPGGY